MAKVALPRIAIFRQSDSSNLGLIDYSLMGFGSALAVWSAGIAISQTDIAWFSASLVFLGTLVGFLIKRIAGDSKWLKIDGVLYTLAALSAFIFIVPLQRLMPSEGFPREVFAAGFLTWMLIFGSIVSWRDTTLLFQAVPAIAMFGLIGCYDTYRNVVFPFYGFLLCLATFFARAHGRQMLHQAADSGYFARGLAPGAPEPVVEVTPGLADRMREGPWRWVAGPEWALASALVIVLFSFLGTPVIQQSVQGVAGIVKVVPPRVQRSTPLPPVVGAGGSQLYSRVGQGPARLTDEPVLQAVLDRARYLRNGSFYMFSADANQGFRWSADTPVTGARDSNVSNAIDLMDENHIVEIPFRIRPLVRLETIPYPGEPVEVERGVRLQSTRLFNPSGNREISGRSIEVDRRFEIANKPDPLPEGYNSYTEGPALSKRVLDLVEQVTEGKDTDYQKARAIRNEVARRIRYNINAPAVPPGADAVDHTLFVSQEAYCDLYATCMVLMCRAAGIPARYVTGFLTGEDANAGNNTYIVRQRDAHAWAEVLFDGAGWVIFDATEGADSVEGSGVRSSNDREWYEQPWFLIIVDILLVALPIAGVAVFLIIRRRRGEPNYRTLLDKSYLRFSGLLHRATGVRRQPGTTASEYLQTVLPKLGAHADEADGISREFESAYYSSNTLLADRLSDIDSRIEALVRALKGMKPK